jgi:hypothetical protein
MQFGFAYMIFVAALIVGGLLVSFLVIKFESRVKSRMPWTVKKLSPAEEQKFELDTSLADDTRAYIMEKARG